MTDKKNEYLDPKSSIEDKNLHRYTLIAGLLAIAATVSVYWIKGCDKYKLKNSNKTEKILKQGGLENRLYKHLEDQNK